jgi:glycosyltransferase involved in cell wall biosynthesis
MRICMISPYPPQTGGVPVHAEALAESLSEKHEVHVITYGRLGREGKGNLIIHEIPVIESKFLRGLSFYIGAVFKLRSLCREKGFDVIHAQYMHPPGTAAAKFRNLHGGNEKVVVTAHGSDLLSVAGGRLGRWVIRWVAGHCDALICVSDYLAKEAGKLGIGRDKIRVVHNGIETGDFPRISREKARKALNFTGGKIVTFAGSLTEAKGADIFLLLAEHLSRKKPDMTFVFVGDGPEMGNLRAKAERRGLSEFLKFAGAREHGETLEYMKASDVVVVPSRTEGFGLTALEAALMEVPVVASRSGALPEVLSGHSLSDNMPHDVMRVLSDREFRESMVRNNLRLARKFTLKRMRDETEKVYRSAGKSS